MKLRLFYLSLIYHLSKISKNINLHFIKSLLKQLIKIFIDETKSILNDKSLNRRKF